MYHELQPKQLFVDNTLALGAQKNVKQLIKDGKVILSIGEISTSEQRVDLRCIFSIKHGYFFTSKYRFEKDEASINSS